MTKKNIAIIRNAASYDFGGGERFPIFLSDILMEKGFHPTIITRSQKLLEFAHRNNIDTLTGWWWHKQNWSGINNLLIPFYIFWQFLLTGYYRRLFTKQNPIAVHIQSKDDFIAATRAAKSLGIRVVWTDHADLKHVWRNISVWYKNPIGKMVYKAAQYADVITVVSKSELSLVSAHLPESSSVRAKLQVVYNGVIDSADAYPAKKNETLTYLVASRLVKDKGIQEVIDAFTRLHEKHPDTQLQLIGNGPEAELFKQEASRLSAIHLLGHQSQPLSFMADADVFVHPTYHEGFSVALVEASMMSLPIIATSVGGNVEIIKNEETGLLVAPQNSDELFEAMEKLYNNEPLRKKLAENARTQYVEKFQFDVIVENSFIPLYEEKS
jgi:glycosyltransferase involved in cell wall biosynthesis